MIVPIVRSSPGSIGDHRVADAARLHVGAQVRGAEGRGERDDGVLGVDQAGELVGDRAVGGLHRRAVVARGRGWCAAARRRR
jgi:hypothetical protein